ncbi:MAG TPA: ABC transporter ATP-binding protein [candidate division Zixibacteria bacterium]|nr:ABC transporter ATP-binding protein [candidate division Zixibacteria bacterium]
MSFVQTLLPNLKRALVFVWQSSPVLTAASVVLVFVLGLLPLAGLYLIKLVVDAVSAATVAADKAGALEQVVWLVLLSGGVALLELLCTTVSGVVGTAHSQLVTDRMQDLLHAKSIEVDLEYYENPQYYDTLHRAQQEAPFRPNRILHGLLQLGQSAVSLVAIVAVLVSFHWLVPVLLAAAAIPGLLVRFRHARKIYAWERENTRLERQASYFNWLLTRDTHAKEIRLFNLGRLFADRFRDLRAGLRRERLGLTTRRSVDELITQSSAVVAAFGLYAFLAARAAHGLVTLGELVMFYQGVQRGQSYLRQFLGSIARLYEDNLFLSNMYEFLNLRPKIVESRTPKSVRPLREKGIVFDHVGFQYPLGDRKVLEDISLTIRPGEHIALVGENGAGKTTLVKLLCRLYDPTEGRISLDGIDLRDLAIQDLRRNISVILQDYARYHLTARDNIWLGNTDLEPGDGRVVEAAREAGAHDAIAGLKNGYDTILGKWFEKGEELSVGEWQKIALARAFLRRAQIMIMDEPTSSMDARAEYEVFEKFHELARGRTVILISHRLSTVRMADRIYFLEGGRIVERGTHDELLDRGGKYARLFEIQAQYYR